MAGTSDVPMGREAARTLSFNAKSVEVKQGLRPGDRCRQKIRVTKGWLSCPGRYEVAPTPRRRWCGLRR